VYCLDGKGNEVWRALVGSVVRDVAAADLNGDGVMEIICGAADGATRILSARGRPIGAHAGPASVIAVAACRRAGGSLALSASRDGTLEALQVSR
jgi:FG-GAP repeat protein